MSRVLHAIEKGIRLFKENSDSEFIDILFGNGAPAGSSGETDAAPIGSQYSDRTNGQLYIKQTSTSSPSDWTAFGTGSVTFDDFLWRNEKVRFATVDALSAGNVDISALSDNDDMVIGDIAVGEFVLSDIDGTPALFEITALPGGNNITIAAASIALSDNNTFVVQQYLPDPAGQENQAIIHFPLASGPSVKIGDIDWNFADGISLAAGYTPASGDITSADSVQSAIEKLDGNNDDQDSVLGTSQGAVDLGTFTGATISDNNSVKGALQELETAYEETDANVDDLITLSGVAENSVDLGSFTGDIISDANTVKGALQELETELVDTRDNADSLISLSGVAENATDLGTFTGDIISDNSTIKVALQELETELVDTRDNADDLISLSGVAENSTDFGTFAGSSLADNQNAYQLFERIEVLLEQMRGVQVAGITSLQAVDAVPHASVKACKWLVEAFEDATPANRKAFEIYALTDGSSVDNTVYSKLKLGANFDLVLAVAINGANMELQASSGTAGVTVTARRIEVVKSVL